jgi:hypothetical protein
MDYIRSHWQGKQSLAWSFWINLVGLRIVITYVEGFTHPPFTEQSTLSILSTIIFFIVFQVAVHVWQIFGVIRAGELYVSERGSYVMVLLAQLGIAVSLFISVLYIFGAFQSLFTDPNGPPLNPKLQDTIDLDDFTLDLSDDKRRIHLQGDFKIGITQQLALLLEQNPGVEGVVLSSNGGRVTEGRGVARLIMKHGLNTYVFKECKSACTTSFIAGVVRVLGPQGRLGFHQFYLDSKFRAAYIDRKAEQEADLEFYRKQNIAPGFLEKVFTTAHADIWFPDTEELLAAGVVHKILPDH